MSAGRPWHLWVIGILGLLWSVMGQVMKETDGLGLTFVPIMFAAFLAYYAHAMSKKGVIR